MFGFRTLDPDPERAQALVNAVRIYPYAQRDDPPPTRVISPDGRAWSGAQPRGLAYWERLHDVYPREIVDSATASTWRCCASSGRAGTSLRARPAADRDPGGRERGG